MISTPEETRVPEGFATMSPAMAQMSHYPRYLFEQIEPVLGQRILEIGVGYGSYTGWLLERGDVLAADISPECLTAVKTRYPVERLQTARIDLNDPTTLAPCAAFAPDSIVCINVLEHIEDDTAALAALRGVAAPEGRLGIIVPAHPRLYGRMDREAGHYRRYTRGALQKTLETAGWSVPSCRYVNAIGAVGWWRHNRLRRAAGLADDRVNRDMRRADRWLASVARWTDPALGRWFGLSVAALARK
jgi:SAM-dependent methyltransferase